MRETETIERDGLTYRVDMVDDDSPDTSWLGEYTSKPKIPYWDRRHSDLIVKEIDGGEDGPRLVGHSGATYDVEHDTNRNGHRFIHDFQCPDSPEACEQDARRLEDYGNGWSMIGIVVTLLVDGEEAGDASLWGIESDLDDGYRLEVIGDLIAEIDPPAALKAFAETCDGHAATARALLAMLESRHGQA